MQPKLKAHELGYYVQTYLLFSAPDLDISPFSSAYLSGRNRESDANNFLGAVSKLFILWAKYVYWYLSFSGVAATLQTWIQISKCFTNYCS